jgi:ribosomal protein S18 acetylase RimI-like enzyme
VTPALRRPTPADHARVSAAIGVWWDHEEPGLGQRLRAEVPRLWFEHFTTTSWVADHPDGRLAGFLVGFLSPARPGSAYVHFVGVDPDLRRSGLGRELYARFAADAQRAGAHEVTCLTGPANALSVAFHRGLGFTAALDPDHEGPGEDRVLFHRSLGG